MQSSQKSFNKKGEVTEIVKNRLRITNNGTIEEFLVKRRRYKRKKWVTQFHLLNCQELLNEFRKINTEKPEIYIDNNYGQFQNKNYRERTRSASEKSQSKNKSNNYINKANDNLLGHKRKNKLKKNDNIQDKNIEEINIDDDLVSLSEFGSMPIKKEKNEMIEILENDGEENYEKNKKKYNKNANKKIKKRVPKYYINEISTESNKIVYFVKNNKNNEVKRMEYNKNFPVSAKRMIKIYEKIFYYLFPGESLKLRKDYTIA